jgi:class 3 adenylate cyclase
MVMESTFAARLEALADPGGICVSGKFHEEVRRKLDLGFVSKGSQEMKNIEEPVTTFMVELGSVFQRSGVPFQLPKGLR